MIYPFQVINLSSWSQDATLSTKASLAKDWHSAFSTHGLVSVIETRVLISISIIARIVLIPLKRFCWSVSCGNNLDPPEKVWLTNHGLEPLYARVNSEWETFCKLDQVEKEKYSAPRWGQMGMMVMGMIMVMIMTNGHWPWSWRLWWWWWSWRWWWGQLWWDTPTWQMEQVKNKNKLISRC